MFLSCQTKKPNPTGLFPSGKNEAKYFILSMVKINIVWSVKPDWSINFQFHSALNYIHMQQPLLINKSWCRCLVPSFPFWQSSLVGQQSCPCGVFCLDHHSTSHCTMKNEACWGTQPTGENRDGRAPDSHDGLLQENLFMNGMLPWELHSKIHLQ